MTVEEDVNLHYQNNKKNDRNAMIVLTEQQLQHIEENLAIAYFISLVSKRSRQTMSSFLNKVAKMIG